MNAWSLRGRADSVARENDLSFGRGFENVIRSLGEPGFGEYLLAEINKVVSVDFFSVYQLSKRSLPSMFLSSSRDGADVSVDCFRSYQSKLYAQDHTFDSARKLLACGGPAMTYTHQSQFAPAHREAIYRRHGIQDRLSIVSENNDEGVFAANLYRFEKHHTFNANDVDRVGDFAGPMVACIEKHIAISRHPLNFTTSGDVALSERLGQSYPRLTKRELMVCQGLLLGRTYDGIAADLGLSLATVKTYRARAFDKLGINFKSQLFAIASGLLQP